MAEKKKIGWRSLLSPFAHVEAAKEEEKKKKKKKRVSTSIDWEARVKSRPPKSNIGRPIGSTRPKPPAKKKKKVGMAKTQARGSYR